MNTVAERKEMIKQLACDAFEMDGAELTPTALFDEDLGVDSLSVIDLLAGLEKAFGIDIEEVEVNRVISLDAVYDLVAEVAGWSTTPEDQLANS